MEVPDMRALLLSLALLAAACRPDPGVPDYSAMAALLDGGSGPQGSLPGPSPYVPGTKRLAFGLFYEGGASDLLLVDDATRHYYVFENTYSQRSSGDRVEGLHSDELTFTGSPWWGGGLVWDQATSLTGWTTLHVSLSSPDTGLAAINLRLLYGEGATAAEAVVKATDFGWVNDGVWHHLSIPLSSFVAAGANLAKVRGPFVIGGLNPGNGESLLVDNMYME
jgi:hypothetical protein